MAAEGVRISANTFARNTCITDNTEVPGRVELRKDYPHLEVAFHTWLIHW